VSSPATTRGTPPGSRFRRGRTGRRAAPSSTSFAASTRSGTAGTAPRRACRRPVSLTDPAHPADPAAGTVADATPGLRDTEREALARLEAAEVVRRARALSDRERAALSDVRRRDVAGRFAISETRVSQIARMARRKLRGET
jgi:hypothetical protein